MFILEPLCECDVSGNRYSPTKEDQIWHPRESLALQNPAFVPHGQGILGVRSMLNLVSVGPQCLSINDFKKDDNLVSVNELIWVNWLAS